MTKALDKEDRYEHRRLCLQKLLHERCAGSQTSLARALGKSYNYTVRMLYPVGNPGKKNIGEDMAAYINKIFPGWESILDEGSNVDLHQEEVKLKTIRITGEIYGEEDGNLGTVRYEYSIDADRVAYPASGDRCYALRVRGDSMSPRIRHGEIIVIDPDHEPEAGDDVVIKMKDGRMMVKVFLYRRHNEITVGAINAGVGNTTLIADDVSEMHYVSARLPGGAVLRKP